MKQHARPATHPNYWIGLLGLIAYAVPTAAFLWALAALLIALRP